MLICGPRGMDMLREAHGRHGNRPDKLGEAYQCVLDGVAILDWLMAAAQSLPLSTAPSMEAM